MGDLPNIPLEELFTEMEYPDSETVAPLRYWTVKNTMKYLEVSERQVRRYIKQGKLQYKYKTVKGRKRVYISNLSAMELYPKIRNRKQDAGENNEENTGEPDDVLGALLALAECVVGISNNQ